MDDKKTKIRNNQSLQVEDLLEKSLKLIKLNKNKEALVYLDKILEIDPHDNVAWYLKSSIHDQVHEFSEESKSFKNALDMKHFRKKVDYIRTIKQIDKVLEIFPYEIKIIHFRGHLISQLHDDKDFLHFLRHHLEILEKTVDYHERTTEYELGYKLIWEKMDSFLDSLVMDNDRISVSKDYSKKDSIILHVGATLDQFSLYEQIIEWFKYLFEYGVKSTCLLNNLGISFSKRLDDMNAIENFNKALEIDHKYLFSLNNLGVSQNSVENFNDILEIDNLNIVAYYNKALALYRKSNYRDTEQLEEALIYCETVLKNTPKDKDCWYLNGLINQTLGNQEPAIESYTKALEIAPNNVDIWRTQGELLIEMGNYEEALISLDKATELEPGNMYIWEEKVSIYQKLKDKQRELNCYNKMIEHESYSPALLGKGRILIDKGELDEAIKLLDRLHSCEGQDDLWPQGMFHKARAEAIRNNKIAMIEILKDAFRATVWFSFSSGYFSKKELIELIENCPEFDKFKNLEEFKAILTHDWEHETDDELEKFFRK